VPNPVGIADLESLFRPLTDAEKTAAQELLNDAWEELLAPKNIPDLDDRMADDRVSTGLVVRVVRAMVLRVLRNPEAIRQWSVDDASFTRDSAVSAGLLYALPDEVALLLDERQAAAFTISPKMPSRRTPGSAWLGWP
jgi:hypothetical protein